MSDIQAVNGQSFETRVQSFPSGLTGVVGVRILDSVGVEVTPRTVAGIIENPAGSGSYITSLIAPSTAGQYSVMWDTGVVSPSTTGYDDLRVIDGPPDLALPPTGLIPTAQQVAYYIMGRTKDQFGNIIGTFTVDTVPTINQVNGIITSAARDVIDEIDTDIPAESWPGAQEVIAIRAAMQVELSFFGTQISGPQSAYERLERLYNAAMSRLMKGIEREQAEIITGNEQAAGNIAFGFPSADPLWTKRM